VPWCEDCSRFWNPNSMAADGSCPTCGRRLVEGESLVEPRAPWHFKVLVAAVVVYLGWRAWQGIEWVAQRL
jgi:hypothetical protein